MLLTVESALAVYFLLDFIVTRDTNNFQKSILPVMTREEAISFLESSITG